MGPAHVSSLVIVIGACGAEAAPGTGEEVADEVAADLEASEPEADASEPDGVADAPAEAEVPGDERDAHEYCELTADVFCPYYLRCGRMAAADLEACRRTFLESCNARYEPSYAALADRGALVLSASGIARCAAHLETVACDAQFFDLDGGCDAVWVGQVPSGGACGLGLESFVCDDASTCVIDLSFCGHCKSLTRDETCDVERRCPESAVCQDGSCVARLGVGQACPGEVPCVLGADCVGGRCAFPAIVAVGDPCDAARRCPYAAACVAGRCQAMALLGEPCGAAGCASGRCGDGTCAPLLDTAAPCVEGAECRSGRCVIDRCAAPVSACIP